MARLFRRLEPHQKPGQFSDESFRQAPGLPEHAAQSVLGAQPGQASREAEVDTVEYSATSAGTAATGSLLLGCEVGRTCLRLAPVTIANTPATFNAFSIALAATGFTTLHDLRNGLLRLSGCRGTLGIARDVCKQGAQQQDICVLARADGAGFANTAWR